MQPSFMQWSDTPTPRFPFSTCLEDLRVSLEKEATFDQVYKDSNWKKKILFKFVGLFGYQPDLSFQKEDVDWKIVEQMVQHKELLQAVDDWIGDTNYSLLPQLVEAKKVFEAIQRPKVWPKLFRGFKINPGQQNSGIAQRYKKMNPGDKWEYTTDKPMSFSWHKGTTTAYGNIIVAVDGAKNSRRMFHITHEIIAAIFGMDENWKPADDFRMFTYAESVLIPDGKPIEFTLIQKG